MTMKPFAFKLSPQGRLRWAIASLFLTASLPQALAAGVVVAPGPGGTAQLQTQGGVPIVNIVAPNGAGLSHNQFLDYNVDRQGLVLNNALQAGNSQLAGQLAANPQFNGQAASVILNEVVSRNPSAINGAQEIFGRAADYVLANPNGISVNGASFINTPNASLVVGRPELNDGKLQALGTTDANGQLQVQGAGLRNDGGSVNLIAPRIDSQGRLDARDQLNLTVGRQQVDYASGQVSAVDPTAASSERRIDASLFGAMQAGRINIVSTAEGAGVRVGPAQLSGRDGVSIQSAGDLDVRGEAVADSLQANRAGIHSSQGDVGLRSAHDLSLAAADVNGRDVKLDAGRNLTLNTVQSRKLQEKRENWRSGALGIDWETYQRAYTDSDTRAHGTQVVAQRDARLSAGQDAQLTAARVEAAGHLGIDSGADLRLTAATEQHVETDQGKHTKGFWKADWDKRSEEQRSVTSQLKGGDIALKAKGTVATEGAQLSSGQDIRITAKQVQLGTASRTNASNSHDQQSKFFGVSHNEASQGKRESTAVRSELVAGGTLGLSSGENIDVVGATVKAGGALNAEAGGDVKLSAAEDTREHSASGNSRGFVASAKETAPGAGQYRAGIAYVSEKHSSSGSEVNQHGANLSGSAVQVSAGNELAVKGSTVQSTAGDTTLSGKQVSLLAGQDQRSENADSSRTAGGVYLTAGLDRAGGGVDFSHASSQDSSSASTARTSSVHSSGALTINAGNLLSEGAQVSSGKGLSVTADSVDNRAASDSKASSHQHSSWTADVGVNAEYKEIARPIAGVVSDVVNGKVSVKDALDGKLPVKEVRDVLQGKTSVTAALSQIGSANVGVDVAVGHASQASSEQSSKAVVGTFAGQDIALNVAGTLRDQGTQYQASNGALTIKADSVQAEAARDTHASSSQQVTANVSGRIYTKTGSDVNVTAAGSGSNEHASRDSSTAVVASYGASQGVNIQAVGNASFEGSRLDGGQAGVTLGSGADLALNQASNQVRSDSTRVGGGASLTVSSLPTGTTDLGGSVQFEHGAQHSDERKAQVASINGNGPVRLNSGGNQTVQGARVDVRGPVELKAGGKLDLQAASDSRSVTGHQVDLGLNLGGKSVSGEQGSTLSGNLGGHIKAGQTRESANTLSGGQLASRDSVSLAGASLHAQGTQVAGPQVNLTAGAGGVLLESAQSTQGRGNWGVELNAGGNLSRETPAGAEQPGKPVYGFELGAKGQVDYLQASTQQNSRVSAGQVALNSAATTQLSGARVEGRLSGQRQGGVSVEERQDTTTSARLNLGLGLTGKPGEAKDGEQPAGLDYKPAFDAQGEFLRKASVKEASGLVDGQGALVTGASVKPVNYEVKATLDQPKVSELTLPSVSLEEGKVKVGPLTIEGRTDKLI